MGNSFGESLRECRKEAGLKQKDLGQEIHIDGSMISRFEAGSTLPNPSTLQQIINALALHEISRERLDRLWEAAGYYRTQIFDAPVADPVVAFVQQEFEKLNSEEAKLLSQDLRSVVEIDQAFFSAKKASGQRRWNSASQGLLSLRNSLERRIQSWYLRIDEELGWCHYSNGRHTEAIEYYESALWSARQLDDRRRQGEILIKLGDAHRRRGGLDWQTASERYDEAKDTFQSLGDQTQVATCLRKIAAVYLFRGLPDKALPLCEESLEICQEEGNERGIYKALQHKMWAYDMLGRWVEATQLGEEALAMVKRVAADDWELAKALMYLGDAYRIQRRVEEAEKVYSQALSILRGYESKEMGVNLLLGMIQLGLGKVYLKQPGRTLEAKSCLSEGLKLQLELGEDLIVAGFLSEQGSLLLKLGRLEEAEMRLQQASDRFRRRLENVFYYADALASLCELYYARGSEGDFDRMTRTAETARSVDNGLIDYHLARIGLTMAKAYVDCGRLSEAFDAFCAASERALKFNDESFREVSEEVLSEIDRIAREVAPEAALQFCDTYVGFCSDKDLSSEKKELVKQSLEAIRQKKEEIRALMPIV